jgi:hypothetical protein
MIENKPKKLDMTKDEYRFLKTEAKSWFDAEVARLQKSIRVVNSARNANQSLVKSKALFF